MRYRSNSVKGGHLFSDANPLFSVWSLARSVGDLLDRALAPSGMGADEFGVYSVLATRGAVTPTELATWLAAPATTVTSQIKRLDARGHLERRANPDDGRSYLLGLTAEGRRAHRAAAKLFAPVLARVEAALGDDGPTARESLMALRRAVDAVRDLQPWSVDPPGELPPTPEPT